MCRPRLRLRCLPSACSLPRGDALVLSFRPRLRLRSLWPPVCFSLPPSSRGLDHSRSRPSVDLSMLPSPSRPLPRDRDHDRTLLQRFPWPATYAPSSLLWPPLLSLRVPRPEEELVSAAALPPPRSRLQDSRAARTELCSRLPLKGETELGEADQGNSGPSSDCGSSARKLAASNDLSLLLPLLLEPRRSRPESPS